MHQTVTFLDIAQHLANHDSGLLAIDKDGNPALIFQVVVTMDKEYEVYRITARNEETVPGWYIPRVTSMWKTFELPTVRAKTVHESMQAGYNVGMEWVSMFDQVAPQLKADYLAEVARLNDLINIDTAKQIKRQKVAEA